MSSKPRRTLSGPIFRVRTGCLTCRSRKKKCDEEKPRCRGCERNRLECRWPPSSSSSHNGSPPPAVPKPQTPRQETGRPVLSQTSPSADHASLSVQEGPSPPHGSPNASNASSSQPSGSPGSTSTNSSPTHPFPADESGTAQSPTTHHSPPNILASLDFLAIPASPDNEEQVIEQLGNSLLPAFRASTSPEGQVPRALSFLPGASDGNSMDLLSHYLSVTSLSMANGSTNDNPFSVQLIPLAFGSDLVLELLLTQSAVHRAAKSRTAVDQVAAQYYSRSLRRFQETISNFVSGRPTEQTLILGISALILCYIETAKGDINGNVFDHLIAANSLLLPALSLKSSLPKALGDFIVEYYLYTATLSMISIDARLSEQIFLSSDVVLMATELVAASYIGNLCGCWMDMILLIPSIFDLGRRFLTQDDASHGRPSADDFLLFAQLQSQIQSWTPSPAVSAHVALAGYIYQNALLLYLYTALHLFSRTENGIMDMAIQTALAEGLSCLAQLPPSERINTSLCWPIAVIGSCVQDEGHRTFLRERLGHMFTAIGLGNIHQTAVLLQHVWEQDDAAAALGPWSICRVMNEKQVWISFA